MKIHPLHSWDITPKEAIQLQKKSAKNLSFSPLNKKITYIAGADISCSKNDPHLFAAVVVMKLPSLEIVEIKEKVGLAGYPYIPGLLSFRELPLLCEVFAELEQSPDVVICDGQGIAHPRGIGIASHLGLIINTPTIGCAKTILVGTHRAVGEKLGASSVLKYQNKIVGAALRTRENVKPVFVSPGNLIDLKSSLRIIKKCLSRYRIPEPTRQAHKHVNIMRTAFH